MGNSSTDGNEAEYRYILCSALPVHLFLVLGPVCAVMLVVDKVEPGVLVSDEYRLGDRTGTNIGKASADKKKE